MEYGTLFLAAAGIFSLLAFFGGIALVMWVDHRGRWRQRELENTERLKALELGQQLPDADVARAKAERSRARAAGAIGVFVPVAMAAGAAVATVMAFEYPHQDWLSVKNGPPILFIIWLLCAVVVLVTVVLSLRSLRRLGEQAHGPRQLAPKEKTIS